MRNSTRKLVGRLRQLIKEAAEGSRRAKAHNRTPFEQRPPLEPQPDWAVRAHWLCAARAAMRGRLHRQAWRTLTQQRIEIDKTLEAAAKWEKGLLLTKVHPTFPSWLRRTMQTALASIDADKARQLHHDRRHAVFKLTDKREAS